jgi:hypothetical protein
MPCETRQEDGFVSRANKRPKGLMPRQKLRQVRVRKREWQVNDFTVFGMDGEELFDPDAYDYAKYVHAISRPSLTQLIECHAEMSRAEPGEKFAAIKDMVFKDQHSRVLSENSDLPVKAHQSTTNETDD